MPEATFQDRLPLDAGTPSHSREARAEAMSAAGIRPPQRYEVIPADHFDPVRPRRDLISALLRLIRRHR
jgi:hypothetical protein